MTVRVPATSANLGPGFDALGLALSLHLTAGVTGHDVPPADARECDDHHPAQTAFVAAGGSGRVWTSNEIPMGKGLGFSGAARVAGICLARLRGSASEPTPGAAVPWRGWTREDLALATHLEGHADNVAASFAGGLVATAAGRLVVVPTPLRPAVVVWVPNATTSTSASRKALAGSFSLEDATFNIGRTALLVAAFAAGDVEALADATADRVHQDARLAAAPGSASAIASAADAGAWCAWLSGSGPTVAALCDPERAAAVCEAMPAAGRTLVLTVDHEGTCLVPGGQ